MERIIPSFQSCGRFTRPLWVDAQWSREGAWCMGGTQEGAGVGQPWGCASAKAKSVLHFFLIGN